MASGGWSLRDAVDAVHHRLVVAQAGRGAESGAQRADRNVGTQG
ncbi:hypothetical protein [Streptomyces lasiicapitis]